VVKLLKLLFKLGSRLSQLEGRYEIASQQAVLWAPAMA
jgi:hypothetical protein